MLAATGTWFNYRWYGPFNVQIPGKVSPERFTMLAWQQIFDCKTEIAAKELMGMQKGIILDVDIDAKHVSQGFVPIYWNADDYDRVILSRFGGDMEEAKVEAEALRKRLSGHSKRKQDASRERVNQEFERRTGRRVSEPDTNEDRELWNSIQADILRQEEETTALNRRQLSKRSPLNLRGDEGELLKKARALSKEYLDLLQDFQGSILGGKTTAAVENWDLIARWTERLAGPKDSKYHEYVDWASLKAFNQKRESEAYQAALRYESKCKNLIDILNSKEFRTQFDALGATKTTFYLEITDGFSCSHQGRAFLHQQFETADSNTPSLLLSVWQSWKRAAQAEQIFWWLAESGSIIVHGRPAQALKYIEDFLKTYLRLKSAQGLTKVVSYALERTSSGGAGRTIAVAALDIEKLRPLSELAGRAAALVNLALALKATTEDGDTKHVVALIGAFSELFGAFEIGKNFKAGSRFALERQVTKFGSVSIFSVITGICEAHSSMSEAVDVWNKTEDYEQVFVKSTKALCGLATAVGAILECGSVSLGVWYWASVFLVGLTVDLFFDSENDSIGMWLKYSKFGKNRIMEENWLDLELGTKYVGWENNFPVQYNELMKALMYCEAKCAVDYRGYSRAESWKVVTVEFKPAFLFLWSKAKISISLKWYNTFEEERLKENWYRSDEFKKTIETLKEGEKLDPLIVVLAHTTWKLDVEPEKALPDSVDINSSGAQIET
ncbi:MAG TPA: hypothetical protein VF815_09060, partial [Myxococcaceae bacterium]